MSIIVRLQNLPLSAKSGDIRKFFGGLRIPDGGVHILGGEKGDAFIIFCSDEDARLALRKDGTKLKDARIKLFLSSRMEMQHEVEKIAKRSLVDSFHKSDIPEKAVEDEIPRHRSTEKRRRFSRSRSPSFDEYGNRNGQRLKSSRYRSFSPKQSRSPRHSSSPKPKYQRTVSPESHDYISGKAELKPPPSFEEGHSEFSNIPASKLEIQAELERRITEAIEANARNQLMSEFLSTTEGLKSPIEEPYRNMLDTKHIPPLEPSTSSDAAALFSANHMLCCEMDRPDEFYIIMLGLNPQWSFREIQTMLKNMFVPQEHIKWEHDDKGVKTGTAVVKLVNKLDFVDILNIGTFVFEDHKITVNVCPKHLSHVCFHSRQNFKRPELPRQHDLCYVLKGLPFSCTYDDIVAFFQGLEINDIVIFYDDDGRATGTGFVSFTNWMDYEAAESRNGQNIGRRYIKMLRTSDQEMADAKKEISDSPFFYSFSKQQIQRKAFGSKRSLCALVTGLPCTSIPPKKIVSFFSEAGAKPDAVHIILNKKRTCDGRAFVEFTNFLDFDEGLKLHGKSFDGNIVCVKQVLYDEMTNVLASQKVRHYFVDTELDRSGPPLNLPEKVPYLWEPPDATDRKERRNFSNSRKQFNTNVHPVPNFRNESFPTSTRYFIPPPFIPPQVPNFSYLPDRIHLDPHCQEEKLTKQMENFIVENELNVILRKAVAEDSRDPVKFNFSKKQPFIDLKTDDVFSHPEYADDSIKLTKLSPEKEFYPHRSKKASPERNRRYSGTRSPDRKSHKDSEMSVISRSKYDSYSRSQSKDSRHDSNWKIDSYHKSSASSPFMHSDKRLQTGALKGCVVQLSNVSHSVKTEDLLYFLKGFDFYEDTLSRRYTADGQPTADVRVTFTSCKEAGRAIRSLNKSLLNGREVTMFLA